jgi:hypothetical protein
MEKRYKSYEPEQSFLFPPDIKDWLPEELLADAGRCSEANIQYMNDRGIDSYIATGRQKHGKPIEPCKPGPSPHIATLVDKMRRKLQTKSGRAIYAPRKTIVEPVFGQIKQCSGFRQFLLRGIDKARAQ